MKCKQLIDDDDSIDYCLKICELDDSFPLPITPPGLTADRKWYLYKSVRPLCYDTAKQDKVAPKPEEAKQKPKVKEAKRKAEQLDTSGDESDGDANGNTLGKSKSKILLKKPATKRIESKQKILPKSNLKKKRQKLKEN